MRFVKSLLLAGSGLLALGAAGGCAANESSLFVQHALLLEEGGDCLFETNSATYAYGQMDIGVRNAGYALGVSLANQLARLGDSELLHTETSYIRLEGAEVSFEAVSGGSSIPAFTLPLSDTVPPSDGDEPGEGIAVLQLVPPGTEIEEGTYLISITLFGHTLGGTPIEAGEFIWPLDVCNGCLFSCDPESAPPCAPLRGGDYGHYCTLYEDQSLCELCEPEAP